MKWKVHYLSQPGWNKLYDLSGTGQISFYRLTWLGQKDLTNIFVIAQFWLREAAPQEKAQK